MQTYSTANIVEWIWNLTSNDDSNRNKNILTGSKQDTPVM